MQTEFFTNYSDVKFIDKLKRNLDLCRSFAFSVSFIKKPGLKLLASNISCGFRINIVTFLVIWIKNAFMIRMVMQWGFIQKDICLNLTIILNC